MSAWMNAIAMQPLLHITRLPQWAQAQSEGIYRSDTLDTEGFIHCSTPGQIVRVANEFFSPEQELIVLCIDSQRVAAEIKYEESEPGEKFPHIYGSLNIDAVVKVIELTPSADGKFKLPQQLVEFT